MTNEDHDPSDLGQTIAIELRRLREQAGRPSFRQLSMRSEISQSALADYFNGRSIPRIERLLQLLKTLGASADETHQLVNLCYRWEDQRKSMRQVSVGKSGTVNVFLNDGPTPNVAPIQADELSTSRKTFLFEFYRQALEQAGITFRMSLVFMSIGAIVVLIGGALMLARPAMAGPYNISLITALSGILIGSCGGAFAIHANRARQHLTRQAERMECDLQSDRKLEQTLRLIDEVQDPQLRDRLKSVTAMRVLDIGPDPESVSKHLLAPGSDPTTKSLPPDQ